MNTDANIESQCASVHIKRSLYNLPAPFVACLQHRQCTTSAGTNIDSKPVLTNKLLHIAAEAQTVNEIAHIQASR